MSLLEEEDTGCGPSLDRVLSKQQKGTVVPSFLVLNWKWLWSYSGPQH